jgi:probable phosphoglycerate mutase
VDAASIAMPILYFVRHGETDWNRERRLQGQHDIPLNAVGREQASRSGEILRELLRDSSRSAETFDFVSSPLSRARETMERMRTTLGVPPSGYRVDPRLAEISFGRWEGFTFAELQRSEPESLAVTARDLDKWNFLPPDGESYAQLLIRVRDWYEGVRCDTILAAHGGVARALMVLLNVMPPDAAAIGDVAQGIVYELADGRAVQHR